MEFSKEFGALNNASVFGNMTGVPDGRSFGGQVGKELKVSL